MSGNEAEKIYFALFHKDIPEKILHRFQFVSKKIDSGHPLDEVAKYYRIISKTSDLEALELAARYFKKLPILTDKFRIMAYLGETVPENYDVFINENTRRIAGYMEILISLIRTAFKMGKGLIVILAYRV